MKIDGYCIAIVVLILFFMYLDNSVNMEGYADLDSYAPVNQDKDVPPTVPSSAPSDPSMNGGVASKTQDYKPIGAFPKKFVQQNVPTSMKMDLSVVTKDGDTLASLDEAFKGSLLGPQPVPVQVPSNLQALGSRVGGDGNLGDASMGSVGSAVARGANMDGVGGMDAMVAKGSPLSTTDASPPPSTKPQATAGPKKSLETHMVYTTWCGHSKRAMPDYQRFCDDMHNKEINGYKITCQKHDADTEEGNAFSKKHKVRGFPTHFMIVEGKKIEDGVGRTYDELVGKVKELTSSL